MAMELIGQAYAMIRRVEENREENSEEKSREELLFSTLFEYF